jgi:lysozyme
MIIPENSILLSKTFEGFYLRAYLCPAGVPTQGFGHIVKSLMVPQIDIQQGEQWLQQDLMDALMGTIRVCPVLLTVHESWFGAIVDFVFNLGIGRLQTSTLRRRINQCDWDQVVVELNKWVYGGGRKLRGLVLRRKAEGAYFLSGK